MSWLPSSRHPKPTLTLIRLSNDTEIHIDDIATAALAAVILDDIDGSILAIETALDRDDGSRGTDWRQRAELALKRKRRQRPGLQQRLGELRKAERKAADPDAVTSKKDGRRRAFIKAAEELLPPETIVELWARAAERSPDLFVGAGHVANAALSRDEGAAA